MSRLVGTLIATVSVMGCVPQAGGDVQSTESSLTAPPPVFREDFCLTEAPSWTQPIDSNGNSNGWWNSAYVSGGPMSGNIIYGDPGYPTTGSCPFGVVDFALPDPAPASSFSINVAGWLALYPDQCTPSSYLAVQIYGQSSNGDWTTISNQKLYGTTLDDCDYLQQQQKFYIPGNAPYSTLRLVARLFDDSPTVGFGSSWLPVHADATPAFTYTPGPPPPPGRVP